MYLHNNIGNILKLNLCDFVNYWEKTLNVQIIEAQKVDVWYMDIPQKCQIWNQFL